MLTLTDLQRIAEVQFADIVQSSIGMEHKIRIILNSRGLTDVHLSRKLPGRFSFHWESGDEEGTIHRYDNFPDRRWSHLPSYPFHFHRGNQYRVEVPPFPKQVPEGFVAFMEFVREQMK